ncbi:MAG: hypothetical protein JKY94_11025 [Rhodobacteraceae bacterium]|nr:hypothetical protein [Paracoccaceae bacterium]
MADGSRRHFGILESDTVGAALLVLIVLAMTGGGFFIGHSKGVVSGRESTSEYIAYEMEVDAQFKAGWARELALFPDTKEGVCERVYDMVLMEYHLREMALEASGY